MNIFEEACALSEMLKNTIQVNLAKELGVTQSCISNTIRMLKFSEEMRALICEKGLSKRHARTVLRLPEEMQRAAILYISDNHLNVRETEAYVENLIIQKEREGRSKK